MQKSIGNIMDLLHRKRTGEGSYTKAEHLRKIFSEQMDNLHLLAFLLTANEEKAQECIVFRHRREWQRNARF
jgi:hypothetical protein